MQIYINDSASPMQLIDYTKDGTLSSIQAQIVLYASLFSDHSQVLALCRVLLLAQLAQSSAAAARVRPSVQLARDS